MIQLLPFFLRQQEESRVKVLASAKFSEGAIELSYELEDPENLVERPRSNSSRTTPGKDLLRADNLWKSTCFEAFWSVPGRGDYWEFNINADATLFNVYRFTGYRAPQPPQTDLNVVLDQVDWARNLMQIKLKLNNAPKFLEFELAAIIKLKALGKDPSTLYFANCHLGEKPDFHLRQAMCLSSASHPP